MKYFLISIDVEGDNLWQWDECSPITTANGAYVERFQVLCEKYGFKPTYLVNYEMANDKNIQNLFLQKQRSGLCEVGMHMHAWNTPPYYELKRREGEHGKPFLTEYPLDVMEKKICELTELIGKIFETAPIVHRAGRWGINKKYLELLNKYGYLADTSVVPGMDLSVIKGWTEDSHGVDFTKYSSCPFELFKDKLWEVPVTTFKTHHIKHREHETIIERLYYLKKAIFQSRVIYLRPKADNLDDMLYMTRKGFSNGSDYIMFMMHSSEMMPGGSPTFPTAESIERMYSNLEKLFCFASKHYYGETIGNYRTCVLK